MRTGRRGLALLIACIMTFSTVAISASAVSANEETGVEYEVMNVDTPTNVDFSCVISESGEVSWKMAVTSFEKLAANLSDDSDYLKVEVLPQNDEAYPYLYPDSDWKMFIMEDEIPSWFTDSYAENVMNAFEDWKSEAYGLVELDVLLDMTNPREIEAGEPTEEDIANLAKWADVYNYLTVYPRNSVRDTIFRATGTSITSDAWNYVIDMVWTQEMEDIAGEKQVSLLASIVGSAFTGITEWKYYVGDEEGYPFQAGADLAKHGYLVNGGNIWSLYSAATSELIYTAEAYTTSKAFACVVAEDGTVYSHAGLDYCSGLINEYGLDEANVVQINVIPSSYFNADSTVTLKILNTEVPAWYTDDMEADVIEAYESWRQAILSAIDCEGLLNCLTDESFTQHAAVTDEAIVSLREWVAIWNEANDNGESINGVVSADGWNVVGPTVWNAMDSQILRNYKLNHDGCPGPTTSPVVDEYLNGGLDSATDDFMGSTINDTWSAYIGSFIPGLDEDENGNYIYQSSADLWNAGFIPMYDGTTWYLLSGPDGDVHVVYAALNSELLADPVSETIYTKQLEVAIEYAEQLKADGALDNVVGVVKEEFEAALLNAYDVLNSTSTTQDDADVAFIRLMSAIMKLNYVKGDKTQLERLVTLAKATVEYNGGLDKYVDTSSYEEALAAAETALANENALQDDIYEAYENLWNAFKALRLKADKSALQALIDKAQSLNLTIYTEESVAVLNTTLASAIEVNVDESLSEDDQAAVNKAADALADAIDGLVETVKVSSEESASEASSTGSSSTGSSSTGSSSTASSSTGGTTTKTTSTGSTTATKTSVAKTGDFTPLLSIGLFIFATGAAVIVKKKRKVN